MQSIPVVDFSLVQVNAILRLIEGRNVHRVELLLLTVHFKCSLLEHVHATLVAEVSVLALWVLSTVNISVL